LNTPLVEPRNKLVDIDRLVEIIFDEKSAPSKRFLMQQKAHGNLPHFKMGRRVFYDPEQVFEHITSQSKKATNKDKSNELRSSNIEENRL